MAIDRNGNRYGISASAFSATTCANDNITSLAFSALLACLSLANNVGSIWQRQCGDEGDGYKDGKKPCERTHIDGFHFAEFVIRS